MRNKKGQMFSTVSNLVVGLLSVTIVLAVGFVIFAQTEDQIVEIQSINESDATQFTNAYNASKDLTGAMSDVPGWMPLIVLAVIGSVLIGLTKLFRN